MKHLNKIVLTAAVVYLSLFSSCSDDNDPVVVLPSRVIDQIEIYKGTYVEYNRISVINLAYDSRGKLSRIDAVRPFTEVNYTYTSTGVIYSHAYELPDGGNKEVNQVTAKVDNGRANICSSTVLGNCVYFYKEGFLSEAAIGKDIQLNYNWTTKGMNIADNSRENPTYYSTEYIYSDVPNNYSIDLNILAQLIDERKDYCLVMNTYGTAIGILGAKYKHVLENTEYTYEYMYDKNGRLSILMLKSNIYSKPDTYFFKLRYLENK